MYLNITTVVQVLNFIVLGYVPGTTIRINFYTFLIGVYGVSVVLLISYFIHFRYSRRKLQSFLPYLIRRQLRRQARNRRLALKTV
jgi:hypothetical protein